MLREGDVQAVVKRDVVAERPSIRQERCHSGHIERPCDERTYQRSGECVSEVAPEDVAAEDLGHFYMEVFDGPFLSARLPGSLGQGETERSAVQDLDTG